jgi:hypothetical protein
MANKILRSRKQSFILVPLLFVLCCDLTAQKSTMLPRSVPEAEGVSSNDIVQFLNAASKSKTEFHSFMLVRHGKVIAEGWWNPYRADLKLTMYSCSKSFTATAVGFAYRKKTSLNDKVISFFPHDLPDTVSNYLSQLTVKDVLMMSDGQEPDPTGAVGSKYSNWIKGFLATPILHEPGSVFLYNSLGTYMLSAMVQKVTGEKIVDYLKPRLFDPLGIQGMDWETDMQGINTGGWGLRLKTEDMAKFAELFLQKGEWNGKNRSAGVVGSGGKHDEDMQDPNACKREEIPAIGCKDIVTRWRCRHDAVATAPLAVRDCNARTRCSACHAGQSGYAGRDQPGVAIFIASFSHLFRQTQAHPHD